MSEHSLLEFGLSRQNLAEYFNVWAIHEQTFNGLLQQMQTCDVLSHVRQAEIESADRRDRSYSTAGQTAIVSLSGPLMKQETSFSGSSTVSARRQIRNAVNDSDVSSILIHVDSPGGTSAGTKELADEVAAAAQQKPTWAFIEDLGASAAYWVASQAERVYSNEPAVVGSIGTYMAVRDSSGAAEMMGVKVHVIRAGEFKGAGTPGTEITEAQLAEWQRSVDGINNLFTSAVASGRRMSKARVEALADGRVHLGAAAADLGLTDGVKTFDETLHLLQQEGKTMATTPVAATLDELQAAFPQASAEFKLAQLSAGATMSAAQQAFAAEQAKQLKAEQEKSAQLAQQLQEAQQSAAEAAAKQTQQATGVDPQPNAHASAGTATATDGAASSEYDAEVRRLMKAEGLSRRQACLTVARRDKGLLMQTMLEHNQDPTMRARIMARYAD